MKAKLKGSYPEPPQTQKNPYGKLDVLKAAFWKSKCLCEINRRKLILENRDAEHIII